MPPVYGKLYIKDPSGNISQIIPEAYNPSTEYVGATASVNGTAGLVPPALSAQMGHFLGGDGSWHNVNLQTAVSLSGSAIDLASGSIFLKTITANTTFTIAAVPEGKATAFNLILTNGGSKTIAWPASVKWPSGIPPVLSVSGVDVLTFLTPDGGTTWYGTPAIISAA